MIILDTNVMSELMRTRPDDLVIDWIQSQSPHSLYMTSINVFELSTGLFTLPTGRRRTQLTELLDALMAGLVDQRLLVFDRAAADRSARIMAKLRAAGRPIDIRDAMIGGIALANGATLATRNIRHFTKTGVRLVNPWEQTPR